MQNWKTTVNGILALLITILTAVLTYQVPNALLSPEASRVWLWITAGCTLGCGIARAVVGFLQTDSLPNPPTSQSSRSVGSGAKLGAWALIAILLAATMPVMATQGCSGAQVINEINVVLNEADSVLAVADPGASWVTPLKNAIAALQGAETNWQGGGTVAIVDDALNTLSIVLAAIPLTAVYSPLIDVLVAGIEAVLAVLPVSTSLKGRMTIVTVAENPHAGRYTLVSHWYHTPAGNLKANWNSVAKAHGLAQMLLK